MRLSCSFKTDKIPVCHHMMFVSLLKKAFANVDEDLKNDLYYYDENKQNKQSKDFSTAVALKEFEKQGEEFLINDRVVFTFTTPDYNLGINLYNGLLELEEFQYKGYSLDKFNIYLEKEKEIKEEEVFLKTISPLCIKDKNNQFLDLENDNFVEELNYIADLVLKNYRGEGLKERLEFEPVDMKKVVVKEKIDKFTAKTGRDYFYVNSFAGKFKLKGNIKDLKLIYQLGLGFKRNQGFGLLEVC